MVSKSRPRMTIQSLAREGRLSDPAGLELSGRDLEVLRLIVEGFADKEIARDLGVSVFTVNKSVQAVLRCTGSTSRTQAAVRAIKLGLVD
jgi:DNA-binding NarL/FixJ family response regulator